MDVPTPFGPTKGEHLAAFDLQVEEHASAQYTRDMHSPQMEVWARLPIFYFSTPLRIFGPDAEIPFPSASKQLD
jgi:hypothetical protein